MQGCSRSLLLESCNKVIRTTFRTSRITTEPPHQQGAGVFWHFTPQDLVKLDSPWFPRCTLFSHKHISLNAPTPLWYNVIGMIPSSSSQFIHRNDDNMFDSGKFHFQVRHVVDQVAATRLVGVRRASKYELFTFLFTFSPEETFPSFPQNLGDSPRNLAKKAF